MEVLEWGWSAEIILEAMNGTWLLKDQMKDVYYPFFSHMSEAGSH